MDLWGGEHSKKVLRAEKCVVGEVQNEPWIVRVWK